MDKLLQKLRQNMAELSLQGDDFTRQIWQMYATFEEFIDHQQSPEDGSLPSHLSQDAAPPPPAPSGGFGTTVPLSRDADTFYSLSDAMSSVPPSSLSRLRNQSQPVVSDDIALASPRKSRRRRPRRLRRSVDNPLLDTISIIGGDSDDDPVSHYQHQLQPHSPASCTRLHPETDSIGYAGSNSIDSGYKSACPTPDLPDLMYLEHRLEKRGSLASLASSGSSGGSNAGSKPRIPMGTRVMSRGGGVPRSPVTGGGNTPTRRPGSEGSYYEIDQLSALRQALLGSPTDAESRSLGSSHYSPRISPATLPLNFGTSQKDASRRAGSPASPERRPRSASTGSRTRGTRKAFHQAGSPLLASTGSLHRASSPSRRPSLSPGAREESRPPPTWSRHSSPGISVGRGRRPPSPIVGASQENELALLEREIDALLYGDRGSSSQFYDQESGPEFPSPYGADTQSYRPAIASVRKLREDQQEAITSSSVNKMLAPKSSGASQPHSESSSESLSSNITPPEFTFCSSDVAQCVLAMLDDFPKTSGTDQETKASRLLEKGVIRDIQAASGKPRYRTTPYPRQEEFDDDDGESSCLDYHLYEEIVYETSGNSSTNAPKVISPPPLPARPPLLLKSELEMKRFKSSLCKQNSVPIAFDCCKCTCDLSKLIKESTGKICNEPPIPPVRTTSQLSLGSTALNLQLNCCSSMPSLALSSQSSQETIIPSRPPKPIPPPRILSKPPDSSRKEGSCNNSNNSKKDNLNIIENTDSADNLSSKPKQRSNLYSIFRDRHHRRFLSASLELEYNHQPIARDESLKNSQEISELGKAHKSGTTVNHSGSKSTASNLNSFNPKLKSVDEISKESIVRRHRTGATCSLDVEDDYGFQVLPHVV